MFKFDQNTVFCMDRSLLEASRTVTQTEDSDPLGGMLGRLSKVEAAVVAFTAGTFLGIVVDTD